MTSLNNLNYVSNDNIDWGKYDDVKITPAYKPNIVIPEMTTNWKEVDMSVIIPNNVTWKLPSFDYAKVMEGIEVAFKMPDTSDLIKELNDMLNSLQKTTMQTQINTVNKVETSIMETTKNFSSNLEKQIKEAQSKLTNASTKDDIKRTIQEVTTLQTNLDKLVAAATDTVIEENIANLANAGRTTIYEIATTMDKILEKIDNATKTISKTTTNTDEEKSAIKEMLNKIEENKAILMNNTTNVMEKVAELTQGNIDTIQEVTKNMKLTTDAGKATIINDITKKSIMAYDIKEIEKNTAMYNWMKNNGYITNSEIKTGKLASEKTVNGVTAFQAMIEYIKTTPTTQTIYPKLVEMEITSETAKPIQEQKEIKMELIKPQNVVETKIETVEIKNNPVMTLIRTPTEEGKYTITIKAPNNQETKISFDDRNKAITALENLHTTNPENSYTLKENEQRQETGITATITIYTKDGVPVSDKWSISTKRASEDEAQKDFEYEVQKVKERAEREGVVIKEITPIKSIYEKETTKSTLIKSYSGSETQARISSPTITPVKYVLDGAGNIQKSITEQQKEATPLSKDQEMLNESSILSPTMKTGESFAQYFSRLSDAGIIQQSSPKILSTTRGGDSEQLSTKTSGEITLKEIGNDVLNIFENWYYTGGGAAEPAFKAGALDKQTLKIGEREYTEDMGYWELLSNGIGELVNDMKGIPHEYITVDRYVENENTQALKDAAIKGETYKGLTEYNTRVGFYEIATQNDLAKMIATERGAEQLAIDLTIPEVKNKIESKLSTDISKTVAEQYTKANVARQVTYLPGYEMTKAVDMFVNPYMTGNMKADLALYILGDGVLGEVSGVTKGLTKSMSIALDVIPGASDSAKLLTALVVPGIADTTKLADVLKNGENIWEVTNKNVVPWIEASEMPKLEMKTFDAARSADEAATTIKEMISNYGLNKEESLAKLATMQLTDPISMNKLQNIIVPGKTISQVEIDVGKEILNEASVKLDDMTIKFAQDVSDMYKEGTDPIRNVLVVREILGELPTQNLIGRATTIENGRFMEDMVKLQDDLKTATMETFTPILEKADIQTYTPGWKAEEFVPILNNMKNVPIEMKEGIQTIIKGLGEDGTIEDVIRAIDNTPTKDLTKLANNYGITTKELLDSRDALYALSTTKKALTSDIRFIPKNANIGYIKNIVQLDDITKITTALENAGIEKMVDFANLKPSEITKIAQQSDISESLLSSTKKAIANKINWEASMTEEAELLSKLSGENLLDETGQAIMETGKEEAEKELFKDWKLDTEKETGIWKDDDTGKWSIRDVKTMGKSGFNNFVNNLPLETLRNMEIGQLGKLSSDAEEDMIRKEILRLAQDEANMGVSTAKTTVPEMSITGKSMGMEQADTLYIEATGKNMHDADKLRQMAEQNYKKEERTEFTEGLTKEPKTSKSETKIEAQEEYLDDVQARGTLADDMSIPEMTITGEKYIKPTQVQTRIKESYWERPNEIPTNIDEARKLAENTRTEISTRVTDDIVDDVTNAMNGDINALNKIYNKDINMGEMIDTYNAAKLSETGKMTQQSIENAINALKNGRDSSAAQTIKQLKTSSSLEGYVKSGVFDDITMKDITRLEKEGISPEMTTKLMMARSDAAIEALGREQKSIAFKLKNGDTDFTREELELMTRDKKTLENAIDATWNPLGSQNNILADAIKTLGDAKTTMGKDFKEAKITREAAMSGVSKIDDEIRRLSGMSDYAKELVC
jgi:hypothetical protein